VRPMVWMTTLAFASCLASGLVSPVAAGNANEPASSVQPAEENALQEHGDAAGFAGEGDQASGPTAAASSAADESPRSTGEGLPNDPCGGEIDWKDPSLETLRSGVFRGVCSSSMWLDGLFGDSREFTEVYGTAFGRAGVGLEWNERDDFGVNGFLRAKFPLPALGRRYSAVLGRESEESFIDDNFDELTFLPGAFSDESLDSIWYAGLTYQREQGNNSRTSLGVGLKISSPLNPYVKFRYHYYAYPHETVLLRLRATPFWENEDGLGLTLAGDADWSFTEGYMLRWANTFTQSEATEGVRWKSRLALFQVLDRKSALRYEVGARGETQIRRGLYGGKLTYRRAMWRDWFFIETSASLFWSREDDPDMDCSGCLGVGVGIEVAFGDRYDRLIEKQRQQEPESADL